MPAISPPPPIGDEDRVDRPAALAQDLHADRALAGDHVGIVVRMHERERRARACSSQRVRVGVVVGVAVQHDLARRAPRPRRP